MSSFCEEIFEFTLCAGTNLAHFIDVSKNKNSSSELNMYLMAVQHGLKDVFVNVKVLLRIYPCLMVTNCTGERSFSKRKIIKDEIRVTMKQGRLVVLSLIEMDILRELNFEDIIKNCSDNKHVKLHFRHDLSFIDM